MGVYTRGNVRTRDVRISKPKTHPISADGKRLSRVEVLSAVEHGHLVSEVVAMRLHQDVYDFPVYPARALVRDD